MKHPDLLPQIAKEKTISDDMKEKLSKVVEDFTSSFKVEE
jgi:hypothetical protein